VAVRAAEHEHEVPDDGCRVPRLARGRGGRGLHVRPAARRRREHVQLVEEARGLVQRVRRRVRPAAKQDEAVGAVRH
jgi:hypothetical protein